MEMPMMPTQPSTAPATMADGAVDADAPEGAFEEMLARRLGRQLVGRFARQQGEDAEAGLDGQAMPWNPPSATLDDPAPVAGQPVDNPASQPTIKPLRTDPIVGAPEPKPVRISVNRPGFPQPMAEPGTIQPGPTGDVWTHPSGFADLQLTRGRGAAVANPIATGPLPLSSEFAMTAAAPAPSLAPVAPITTEIPEPPVVRWSPAPARAALAAAANRDLELEIITKVASQTQQQAAADPKLRVVEATRSDATASVPPSVAFDAGVTTVDGAGTAPPPPAQAPMSAPNAALVERVMNAVEMQQHLPPPRAIAIEIPEVEGLRLLVTMRMNGSVHVASSGTNAQVGNEQVTPLLQAVNDALAERGFDMSADTGGRQSANGDAHDEPVPPRSPRFRRAARRTGLRI
jgi:hypothetical protein